MVTATSPTAATTSDSVTTTVQQPSGGQADLVVAKSGAPTVVAGNQLAYTVVVTNNGPSLAQDVTLVDALPSGTIFVAATPSQGTCNGGVTCLLGYSGHECHRYRAHHRDSGWRHHRQPGERRSGFQQQQVDSNLANNRAPFTTTATAQAALYVSKVATPEPAVLGGQLTYRIVVTNAGPSAAQHVTVTDNLPAALLNPVVSSSQGGCVAFPCALGTIPAGGSATLLVVGTVAPTATANIVNTATVTSATSLTNAPAGQTSTVTTTVTPSADLVLSKQDSADPVLAGTNLIYTLRSPIVGRARLRTYG